MVKNKTILILPALCLLCVMFTLTACPSPDAVDNNFKWLTESATDYETTITLTSKDRITLGNTEKWGSLRVEIIGTTNCLTAEDDVELKVLEDDSIVDDLLWSENFTVNASEASANEVNRIFDVVFEAQSDDDGTANVIEVYAKAKVSKDSALYDESPKTSNLNIQLVN